jgi:hypothetical protein
MDSMTAGGAEEARREGSRRALGQVGDSKAVRLAVAFAALAILGNGASQSSEPPVTEQHQAAATQQNGEGGGEAAERRAPVAPPAAVVEPPSATSQTIPNKPEDGTQGKGWKEPWAYGWGIVGVTVIYAIISWRALCAIRRQGDLSREQLEAMRRQAGIAAETAATAEATRAHQIRQERPWLTMKGDGKPTFCWGPERATGRRVLVSVPWSTINVGKDAGWLYQRTVRVAVIKDIGPPDVPTPFTEDPPFGEMPIPPGAAHSDTPGAIVLEAHEEKDIGPGLNCLMTYGVIRYRDNAKAHHFTRFCFIWRRFPSDGPNLEVWHYTPVGPAAYIEYT